MWKLDHKESWAPKNWCFWTVVLEKTLENPLDCKIQPVSPKGDQSWVFIGRTDVEAETLIFRPPDVKNWLIGKWPWCWERLKAGGEGEDREWDGWMTSPTQWPWVWVNSRSWWWTGRPGMLRSMGSQRIGHKWATELNWLPPFVQGEAETSVLRPLVVWLYFRDGGWKADWQLCWAGSGASQLQAVWMGCFLATPEVITLSTFPFRLVCHRKPSLKLCSRGYRSRCQSTGVWVGRGSGGLNIHVYVVTHHPCFQCVTLSYIWAWGPQSRDPLFVSALLPQTRSLQSYAGARRGSLLNSAE